MRRRLIAALLAAAFSAQADTTSAGHTCTPPEAFSARVDGAVARFTASEGDATVTVVDPGIGGIELVRDDKAAAPTLILRDAQHE